MYLSVVAAPQYILFLCDLDNIEGKGLIIELVEGGNILEGVVHGDDALLIRDAEEEVMGIKGFDFEDAGVLDDISFM